MALSKKILIGIASAAFVVAFLPAVACATEAAAISLSAQGSPQQSVLNTSGQVNPKETKSFQVVLAASGKLTVNGSNTTNCDITFQTTAGASLKSYTNSVSSSTNLASINRSAYLNRGTYLVTIKNSDSKKVGNYQLKAVLDPSDETFSEGEIGSNNDMENAALVKPNQLVVGQCSLNDQLDFYKFNVYSKGKVTFSGDIDTLEACHNRLLNSAGSLVSSFFHLDPACSIELDPGVYYIKFEGKGAKYSFQISGAVTTNDIAYADATVSTSYSYTGSAISPSFDVVMGSTTLQNGKDYTVAYANNVNAGTATATVTGKGTYTGTKTVTYQILPLGITDYRLAKTAYVYNGKAQAPGISVSRAGVKLTEGSHYVVSKPAASKAIGTYKVNVSGVGNYAGSATLTYKINPKQAKGLKLGKAKGGFKVSWKPFAKAQASGYQIRYANSKAAVSKAKARVTVKGYKSHARVIKSGKVKKGYYVQVRAYKTVNGVKHYGAWSKVRSIRA